MIIDILFWLFIALLVVQPILTIMLIGKPREPFTPGSAAFSVVFNVVAILVILAKVMESQA